MRMSSHVIIRILIVLLLFATAIFAYYGRVNDRTEGSVLAKTLFSISYLKITQARLSTSDGFLAYEIEDPEKHEKILINSIPQLEIEMKNNFCQYVTKLENTKLKRVSVIIRVAKKDHKQIVMSRILNVEDCT